MRHVSLTARNGQLEQPCLFCNRSLESMLGELPQGFALLSAVYGGTYMLAKPECKVEFDEKGKVCAVTSDEETARTEKVVCDPSYPPNKVKMVGKVACAICNRYHWEMFWTEKEEIKHERQSKLDKIRLEDLHVECEVKMQAWKKRDVQYQTFLFSRLECFQEFKLVLEATREDCMSLKGAWQQDLTSKQGEKGRKGCL